MSKWAGTLSTTENYNHLGTLPVRQGNKNSEIFEFRIVENGQPYDLTGLRVLFCTHFKKFVSVEKNAEVIKSKEGLIKLVMDDDCMQKIGDQEGYFEIYKENFLLDTTQNFTYNIQSSIIKQLMDGESYIQRLEELLSKFEIGMEKNQTNWEKWIQDNKKMIESVDPSGNLLNMIVDAQGDYDSLASRLNATVKVDVDKTIGGYGTQKVVPRNFENTKRNLRADDFNFGFSTDLHAEFTGWPSSYAQGSVSWGHIRNVQSLSDKLDCIVYGGDNVNCSYGSKERNTKLNEKFAAMIARQPIPNLPLIGNHDGGMVPNAIKGRNPKDSIVTSDFNRIFGFDDMPYYYKDFPDKKVRVICIYTNDYNEEIGSDGNFKYHTDDGQSQFAIQQKQFDFLVRTLKECPSDYHVLLTGHAPLTVTGTSSIRNGDLLKQLFEAFKSSSKVVLISDNKGHPVSCIADFSSRPQGIIIGYFCGHLHKQEIKEVGTITQAMATLSGIYNTWAPGNDDEDAFWAVAVNTKKRQVTCHGIGRGKDVTFTY